MKFSWISLIGYFLQHDFLHFELADFFTDAVGKSNRALTTAQLSIAYNMLLYSSDQITAVKHHMSLEDSEEKGGGGGHMEFYYTGAWWEHWRFAHVFLISDDDCCKEVA